MKFNEIFNEFKKRINLLQYFQNKNMKLKLLPETKTN